MKQDLKIQGMHCASCAMNIDDELEDIDGVRKSKTSYARQRTRVEFDEALVSLSAISATIETLGYGVQQEPGH